MEYDLSKVVLPTAGRCNAPHEISKVAARFGLSRLNYRTIPLARRLACDLIGKFIAPVSVYRDVQRRAGAAIFGRWENGALAGVLASFGVNGAGLAQLENGTFDARHLDVALVCEPGQIPSAYYGWGFAARSKISAGAIVLASRAIHRELFWAVPTYARAASEAGRNALLHIGFEQRRPSDRGLLCILPASGAGVAR